MSTETTRKYLFGLDLGQTNDYTAVVALERLQEVTTEQVFTGRDRTIAYSSDWEARRTARDATYHLLHLERLPLGMSYPAMVDRVKALVLAPEVEGRYALVIDQSGVGRPVFDLFHKAGLDAYGVTITGGTAASRVSTTEFKVAKQLLVSVTQVVIQAREPARLKYAGGLQGLDTLRAELGAFRVQTTKAANETYEAREGSHDDLVLALALALWFGESYGNPPKKATSHSGWPVGILQ
jgi:hypothetical protein